MYIENISNTKVLGATSDGEVILEDFEEDKAEQLWKKGETCVNFNVINTMKIVISIYNIVIFEYIVAIQ